MADPAIRIDTCLSPYLFPVYRDDKSIVVVIDVLRATSAVCAAFENGVDKMIPVASLEEAQEYKSKGYLVGAERNGVPVEGFDFGNSPLHYSRERVNGKTIVLTTTNGTQAIEAAKGSYMILIGSFLNLDALCDYLLEQKRSVILLCSGWKNRFNMEDAVFAGAIASGLSDRNADLKIGDASLAMKHLFEKARENTYAFLNYSSHKERLASLDLKKDIKFCLTPNQTKIIPVYRDGVLVRL